MTVAATRRISVDFPQPLLEQTERAASELSVDRSKFIRSAVERYLADIEKQRLEAELAAGYVANAALDREIAKDFAAIDAEDF